ncbi:hypothetical protein B6N60_01454 [Richelia sinica FACHB-800]|uniref:Uncharacterized protein n=1 Tax=Richelia sinica FACHB-800 TaxID=1357546 RepID=A0A975Y437_9NOST|nr:hypothetical protein [Richelia sinica]MBD2663669.1 hypothetical protein [Richelia sinica FACHB-800]QXE22768.1 hypothetical protein B6N60_01454 [Richelia sinica FACHB-800]
MNLHQVITEQLKQLLDKNTPSVESLNNALRILAKHRSHLLQNTLIQQYGLTVQQGLFQGMEFLPNCAEGCYIPKLLGCYEVELQPYFQEVSQRPYEVIINVGAAEGYYAVGLARLMPQVKVFAYDTNQNAHPVCRQLAEKNGVSDRIVIGGTLQPEEFQSFANYKTLVLCDIEGGEAHLLDPAKAPDLAKMDMIVELHEGFAPNVSQLIIERFRATHNITFVTHQGRNINLPPLLHGLGHLDQLLAVWEWRSFPTPWAVMWAKN